MFFRPAESIDMGVEQDGVGLGVISGKFYQVESPGLM
jgi:hypothetical protein